MNKLLLCIVVTVVLSGCSLRYSYLPDMDAIGDNPYGAYINLRMHNGSTVRGELLSLQGDSLIIASVFEPEFSIVDTMMVQKYYLQIGKNKSFVAPPLIAISHGWWMVFTVPLNTIVTVSLNSADKKELRYYNEEFYKLKSFARYPAGLPEGLSASNFVHARAK